MHPLGETSSLISLDGKHLFSLWLREFLKSKHKDRHWSCLVALAEVLQACGAAVKLEFGQADPKTIAHNHPKNEKKPGVTHLHSDLKLLQFFWPWRWCVHWQCGKCHNPKHIKCLNSEVLSGESYCHCMYSSPVFPSSAFPAWGLGEAPIPFPSRAEMCHSGNG